MTQLKIRKFLKNKQVKNLYVSIFLGLLSYLFGKVVFNIPGIEGAASNFMEVPLLIGIFHLSNPLFLIISSFIAAFGTPPDGSFLSTFLMHAGALIILWFVYERIKNLKVSSILLSLIWLIAAVFYYFIIIFLMILTNYLFGLNLDKQLWDFYFELLGSVKFEAATTSVISSLYLVQHKIRKKLINHQQNLEIIVKERTKELHDTIEELKTTQQQLVQSEKMASLGVLSAGVAHEINNPLNFISVGVQGLEILLEEDEKEPEKISEVLNGIKTGVERASNIVTSLNHFSRQTSFNRELINISEVIEHCLVILHNQLKDRVEVVKKLSKEPYALQGNSGRLHQAFLNILTNASQAIHDKGVITIESMVNREKLGVRISDTGTGISPENLTKITDPFFTTKSPGKGTGLGLSITYSIIKEHNGEISFKSDSGIGTIVMVSLPLQPS